MPSTSFINHLDQNMNEAFLIFLPSAFGEERVTTSERMVDLAKQLGWPYEHLE